MSLEAQIAALVTASNNLTTAINGKVSEINQKVKAATDSVPAVVRGLARQVFYIDAIAGDDNNAGTSAAPLKSTAGAQSRAVNGGVVELRFKGGQTHYVDFFFEVGRIVVSYYDIASDAEADRPTLRPSLSSITTEGLREVRGIGVTSGAVYFTGVNIVCQYDDGGTLTTNSGFIRYTNSNVAVTLRTCKIELGNLPFARTYLGYSQRDLAMSVVKIVARAGFESTAKMVLSDVPTLEPTTRLEVRSTTLENITGGWAQLMPLRGASNYLTNLGAW